MNECCLMRWVWRRQGRGYPCEADRIAFLQGNPVLPSKSSWIPTSMTRSLLHSRPGSHSYSPSNKPQPLYAMGEAGPGIIFLLVMEVSPVYISLPRAQDLMTMEGMWPTSISVEICFKPAIISPFFLLKKNYSTKQKMILSSIRVSSQKEYMKGVRINLKKCNLSENLVQDL